MSNNLTVIIVTYNAMPWLDKCLGSINFKKYEVVVVDNNSTDETVSRITSNYPKVKLFQETSNLGFGQANNKGISFALSQGAEQVFLLNQDAYLVEDCLENLVNFQQNNPEFGIVSPIHISSKKKFLDKNFAQYVSFDKNPSFYSDHVLGSKQQEVYEFPYINAAGWLISKKCLTTVGGFDPIFFHYGEDDNYCQRALFHCFKIGVLPKTFIIHDRENRSKPNIEDFSEQYFIKKENAFKIKLADINIDFNAANKLTKKYKRKIIKEFLKANFAYSKQLKKELKLLKNSLPSIQQSRTVNKQKGNHYLN